VGITVEQIEMLAQKHLSCYGGEYEAIGLRVQVGREAKSKLGSVLPASSVWDDGIRTKATLPGTAAFVLEDSLRSNDYAEVIQFALSYQIKGRIALVGTKKGTVCCDMPEKFAEAFPEAVILAIF